MARRMRAVEVRRAGGALEQVERDVPEPGPGQVRLAVDACGICHSDAITKEGWMPVRYPRVPGHEVVGHIDAVGPGVTAWRAGEHVGVGCGYDGRRAYQHMLANRARFRVVLKVR
jgi:D-arabinose 1-dehydrogenase-like Zn-dependent alcohol dehydrogenase